MSGGEDTDPSSEISQIIEKKENPEKENEESDDNKDDNTAANDNEIRKML